MTQRAKFSGVLLGLTAILAGCSGGSGGGSGGSPAPTATLSASPTAIAVGQNSTLTYGSTGADAGAIDNSIGQVGISGHISVSPTQTTTYNFTATGGGGSASASATVTVSQVTVSISARPPSITAGQPSTLTVTATNATKVVITDNEDSSFTFTLPAAGGTLSVTPSVTTTYTASASAADGTTAVATATTVVTVPPVMQGLTSFDGLDSDQAAGAGQTDIDPNGAIGTKQFMEYVNTSYQAYSKVSPFTPVWSPAPPIGTPWPSTIPQCAGTSIQLDAVILFDRLASRWVIGGKATRENHFYFCIAVSKTDDLSSCASTPATCWNAYSFDLNPALGSTGGAVNLPDWPKMGTWSDAYYATMDLIDEDTTDPLFNGEIGVVACAFDRTNMLAGVPQAALNPMQCLPLPSPINSGIYLGHSLIPADVDGNGTSTLAPPAGRDEFMVSIENPPLDGTTISSNTFNLWDFHLDWTTPANSTFTQSSISGAPYTPGCYTASQPAQTICVPEQTAQGIGQHVDSVGDRFMPRFAYRNFGAYESFLVSHTILTGPGGDANQFAQQTGIRWYELRGTGTPSLYQEGTISPDTTLYRFLPSIAQDQLGNAAVGYSVSSPVPGSFPGIDVSWLNLPDPGMPSEATIFNGTAEEISGGNGDGKWGSYSSMTVDPVDDCTFWYVNEYWGTGTAGTPIWKTRIANFRFVGCPPTN